MQRTHSELIQREKKYPTGNRAGYKGFVREMEKMRDDFYADFLETRKAKQASTNELIAAFGALPPKEFTKAYELSAQGLEQVSRTVQRKYVVRFKNIRRSWAILLQYMPELMVKEAPPRDVLEMSTAHGATLEILQYFGHRAVGNDFANFLSHGSDADSRYRSVNELDLTQFSDTHGLHQTGNPVRNWPYRPIVESLGLDVRLFDAGHVPYPFEDECFDSVICLDALEHYCHPKDWLTIIAEFCRLARESVLVITNPVPAHVLDNSDYMTPFYDFQTAMRQYHSNGFRCIYAGLNRNQLTVFKLMRL